jgi:glycosyltransferase involved in cell wall biosynthesis
MTLTRVDIQEPNAKHVEEAGHTAPGRTVDLAVHALAQLPDTVTAELRGQRTHLERAEALARAYGISNRVRYVTSAPGSHPVVTIDGVTLPSSFPSFAALVHHVGKAAVSAASRGNDDVLAGARIAIVTNQPAHYRIPLVNGLADRLAAVGASLRVFFLADTPSSRPWLVSEEARLFDHETLRSLALPVRRQRRPRVPLRFDSRLAQYRPTIVLVAGLSPLVAGRAARSARKLGAALGIWSGEVGFAPSARHLLSASVRRTLLSHADFAIAYGWKSTEYIRQLAPKLPVVVGRNTSPIPAPAGQERAPSVPTLLAIGDLASPRKGIDVVIDALALIPSLECTLKVIGGGDMLGAAQERARNDSRITFLGQRPADATRAEVSCSDVFLFPTRFDVFGLSLVEAMGAGLPSVATRAAGATEDLCVPEVNCLLVEGHTPGTWAEAIKRLCRDSPLRETLATEAAATIAARWTMSHAVDAMIAGLRLGVPLTR